MKEVMAIIRPEQWQATREAATRQGFQEVLQMRVLGRGRQRGLRYVTPVSGQDKGGMQFLPKRMALWLVSDERLDALIQCIIQTNGSGSFGDGKIFVCPVEDMAIPTLC